MSPLLTDWQFWVVSAAALWGAVAIVRPLFRRRKADGPEAACPHCAAGTAACAKKPAPAAGERLVTLGGGRRG